MTGCVFKRKLKTGTSWGYLFSAGKDAAGKRNQVFKSGFSTKGAAQSALRDAITEYEMKAGRITEQVDLLGRRIWGFVLGDKSCVDFESREAAESARMAEIERREAKPAVAAEPTFADYFKYWTDEHAARRCAPKTLERYKELGRYLVKHLGGTRINELTTAQIQHTIHRLKDAGGQITKDFSNGKPLAAKTVRHIGTLLYTALAEADRLGILKIPHPMANKRVVLPKLPKRRPPVLDKDKLRLLFDRARSTRLYPLVVLASATGCRRGELLALEWSDLDESTSEVNVSKSLEQTKAGLRIKSTKSEEPRRFSVPEWALEVLRAHQTEQQKDSELFGRDYEDHNLVFCQPSGAYYSPDRLGARVVELMRKAGLDGVSLHSLRHSHATSLLSNGVPVAVVSERLGHRDQNITLSVYSHAVPADTKAAAKIWNDAMADVIAESRKPDAELRSANACARKLEKKMAGTAAS
ncbi:MAG: site-specific integrase [Acidobacteriota bacterium]|nr:site-specific integrase [Acidobacteriota bacterium]